jgi:hypothetical protein
MAHYGSVEPRAAGRGAEPRHARNGNLNMIATGREWRRELIDCSALFRLFLGFAKPRNNLETTTINN